MASVIGSASKSIFQTNSASINNGKTPDRLHDSIKSLAAHVAADDVTAPPMLGNYINGKWDHDENLGTNIPVFDPSINQVSCLLPDSSEVSVDRAVEAASAAQKAWSATSPALRADILQKAATILRDPKRADLLARLESCDVGKPHRLAKIVDIPRAAENFDFFSHLIRVDATDSHAMSDAINYTQRTSVGVAALVTPWNLPLYLLSWKVAPCLACGNTIVCKPSEMTPLTACALAEVLEEAGLPKGVFNIVHGSGAKTGAALVAHPKVRLVSFTGGTTTGRKVAASAASMFKKVSLELGGKNPAVVFNDCDLDKTVEGVTRGVFLNSGQICLCCPRILVQREIYETFRDRFVIAAKAIKVGDPLDPASNNGPVISQQHWEKING